MIYSPGEPRLSPTSPTGLAPAPPLISPSGCVNLLLRLAIAAVFLWASVDKVVHPDRFADIVYDYNLLPAVVINLFAVCLPFVEIALALFLIVGLWVPSTALLATGLTVMFMGAITAALAQGYQDLHCGCFTTSQEGKGEAWGLLWRDAVLLVACAALFWRTWRPRREESAPAP